MGKRQSKKSTGANSVETAEEAPMMLILTPNLSEVGLGMRGSK